MLFAIDIGNTNMVIGCIDGDKILFSERLSTDHSKTALEYALPHRHHGCDHCLCSSADHSHNDRGAGQDHVLQCQDSGTRPQERPQDLHG